MTWQIEQPDEGHLLDHEDRDRRAGENQVSLVVATDYQPAQQQSWRDVESCVLHAHGKAKHQPGQRKPLPRRPVEGALI